MSKPSIPTDLKLDKIFSKYGSETPVGKERKYTTLALPDLKIALLTYIDKEIIKARLSELTFLLEDFGIEDNVQPIKDRLAELSK